MIHRNLNCIFARVPKTAGSSIVRKINGRKAKGKLLQMKWIKKTNPGLDPNHIPLPIIRDNMSKESFDGKFKFGFVRNPWDRAVSQWCWEKAFWGSKKKKKWPKKWKEAQKELESFETFARYRLGKTPMTKYTQAFHVEGCDFIGRFENLQADFDEICPRLKIVYPKLGRYNISKKKKPYAEYYNDELRNIVAKLYEEDIDLFKYVF